MQWLASNGADVLARAAVRPRNAAHCRQMSRFARPDGARTLQDGRSALQLACLSGGVAAVAWLVECAGFDVNDANAVCA